MSKSILYVCILSIYCSVLYPLSVLVEVAAELAAAEQVVAAREAAERLAAEKAFAEKVTTTCAISTSLQAGGTVSQRDGFGAKKIQKQCFRCVEQKNRGFRQMFAPKPVLLQPPR